MRTVVLLGVFTLVACGEKETDNVDTASVEDTENTDTNDTGETDTQETDTQETGSTETGAEETGAEETDTQNPSVDLEAGLVLYASFDAGWSFEGSSANLLSGSNPGSSAGGAIGDAMNSDACFASDNFSWTGASQMAFSFWYQASSDTFSHQVTALDYGSFQVKANQERLTFEIYSAPPRQPSIYYIDMSTNQDVWTHVAFSIDVETQQVLAWVDNVEYTLVITGIPNGIQEGMGTQNGTFRLMRDNCGSQAQTPLRLDEFRLYNRALTPDDVAVLSQQ